MLLRDRVAVVTGGGRGIGRAIATLFHAEGAKVAVASRNVKGLQTFALERNQGGEHRLLPLRCDVRRADEIEVMVGNVIELWDRIDILVNNAGASGLTPILPIVETGSGAGPAAGPPTAGGAGADADPDATWQNIIATNLTGMYRCTREAARHMPGGGTGRILNLSSVLGKFGVPGYAAYCASKHGVIGLTRALALELAPKGITVNALCPGWVDTDMAAQGVAAGARQAGVSPEEFRRRAEARVPLGRFVTPEEVARLALFLVSDAGASITGQSWNLDGGASMW
jgi:NAD(P)-dependent dehydrogenase (short-subunit alcohol dehydrogenase family)